MENIKVVLEKLKSQKLLRELQPSEREAIGKIVIDGREYHDFSSNDYLGLADHPALKKASIDAVDIYGTGSRASRLLSGDLKLHHLLEEKIAAFKKSESALLYNSGYHANIGVISTLVGRDDIVFADKFIHASLIDGIMLSGAHLRRFRHNDMTHLEELFRKHRRDGKRAFIVTESVFSMDGDRVPLGDLVSIKKRFDASIVLDEAHATGIFGPCGGGLAEAEGLESDIDIAIGTFGKALGSFGGFAAGSRLLMEYLINKSRTFIYSTALPPSVVAANMAAIDVIGREPRRRHLLLESADNFRKALVDLGCSISGDTHIVPLIIGANDQTLRLSHRMRDEGYWATAIRPPTVPKMTARIRFSLTYHHTKEVLGDLIKLIKAARNDKFF